MNKGGKLYCPEWNEDHDITLTEYVISKVISKDSKTFYNVMMVDKDNIWWDDVEKLEDGSYGINLPDIKFYETRKQALNDFPKQSIEVCERIIDTQKENIIKYQNYINQSKNYE